MTRRTTQKRAPLSRDRVLRAALELADEGGIGALTMQQIGRRLGVEAMSLYRHVRNKDDILDGIVDLVFAEIELPADRSSWRAVLRARSISTLASTSSWKRFFVAEANANSRAPNTISLSTFFSLARASTNINISRLMLPTSGSFRIRLPFYKQNISQSQMFGTRRALSMLASSRGTSTPSTSSCNQPSLTPRKIPAKFL